MKITLSNLKIPMLVSSIIVLPFIAMELLNRPGSHEDFPVVLFGLMWLLAVAFVLILMPIVRGIRAGNGLTANPVGLLLGLTLLVAIAWLWTGIVLDQMPCFLGVPNCD